MELSPIYQNIRKEAGALSNGDVALIVAVGLAASVIGGVVVFALMQMTKTNMLDITRDKDGRVITVMEKRI